VDGPDGWPRPSAWCELLEGNEVGLEVGWYNDPREWDEVEERGRTGSECCALISESRG